MTDTTDTTTMTGAEFRRHVGTDPHKWAEAFIAAYAKRCVPQWRRPPFRNRRARGLPTSPAGSATTPR